MSQSRLLNAIEEAQVLGIFKNLCDDYSESKSKLRNIMAATLDKNSTISSIIKRKYNMDLGDEELSRIVKMIEAFLKKSEYRKAISNDTKEQLLLKQNYECSFCHSKIDSSAHADHIVPFKYVGDELEDNLQMLCSDCNLKKNASLDYQIRFLLKLV